MNHLNQFRQKLTWRFFLLRLFMIADRVLFALITSWREDQGANLWIGYYYFEWPPPAGLLSSIKIPNLNGMINLGARLAWLPGLIAVSSVLGIIQVVTLFLVKGSWCIWKKVFALWYFASINLICNSCWGRRIMEQHYLCSNYCLFPGDPQLLL